MRRAAARATDLHRLVVVGVRVDDRERVSEARVAQPDHVPDELSHADDGLKPQQTRRVQSRSSKGIVCVTSSNVCEDAHLQMDAGEALALAELEVAAHEEVHERARLAARRVEPRIAAAQDLKTPNMTSCTRDPPETMMQDTS